VWKPTPNTLVSSYGRLRAVAVVARDAGDEPGEPVRREQEVERSGRAQPVPRPDRLVCAARAEPGGAECRVRVAVDRVQDAVAVAQQQPLGAARADVLDPPEVRGQGRVAGGRERLGAGDLDLQPEPPVVLPDAGDPHALPLLQVRDRPDQHELVSVAVGVDHGEARLVARPPPAADEHLALEGGAGRPLDHGGRERIAGAGVRWLTSSPGGDTVGVEVGYGHA
jgi:hypothetical protein